MAKFEHLVYIKPADGSPEYVEYEGDQYFKCAESGACTKCFATTNWISISFLAYLCSEECADKLWKEFFDSFMN